VRNSAAQQDRWLRLPAWVPAAAVGALALALYWAGAPREVLEGDPGEFQFAAYLGGIAHPTGYPLYLIVGWLWSHLPLWDGPATAMNFLSGVFAAAAVAMLCWLVLLVQPPLPRWAAWPVAVAVAAAFAVSPTFWSQAVVAEVYSLHALLLACLFLVVVAFADRPQFWWAIGLVSGLSLAHHRSSIFYIGACALALWRQWRPEVGKRAIVRAALAGALPLLLYAYLPIRAPHTPYLRLALSPHEELVLVGERLADYARLALGQWFSNELQLAGAQGRARQALSLAVAELPPVVWALGLAGIPFLWRRQRPLAVTMLGGLVANVAFNLVYAIGDISVYYIPLYLACCLLAGVVVGELACVPRRPWLAAALALALAWSTLASFGTSLKRVEAAIPRVPEGRWHLLLERAPQGAVLISNDRNEIMPMWYYQYVEGRRPDLLGLFPLIVPGEDFDDVGALLDRALASGRPVCLIKPMPGIEVGFELKPGEPPILVRGRWRVTPERAVGDSLAGQVRLLGYDVSAERLRPNDELRVVLYWVPLVPLRAAYSSYVHLVDEGLGTGVVGSDHRPGGDFYPTTLWPVGDVARDEHRLRLPAEIAPGRYRLVAGMYSYPALEPLGAMLSLGQVEVAAR
jgi:hypothetical protein